MCMFVSVCKCPQRPALRPEVSDPARAGCEPLGGTQLGFSSGAEHSLNRGAVLSVF